MRILFFGTSDFAVPVIEELSLTKHKILGVVTAPDKKQGRGQRIGLSPVKMFAQKKGLPIFQPKALEEAKFLHFLKSEPADLFVVVSYGKLLPKEILQIPQKYAINLHASLLPKYRGAAPINWAIIQGETQSGITIFRMNEYMDRGEIILQEKTAILSSDTAISLEEKLAEIGKEALVKAIDLIGQKKVDFIRQDENQASLAPKLKKADGLIAWSHPALEIHNRVRGLQPWPSAFTYFAGKLLKIWESKVIEKAKAEGLPGEIIEANAQKGILVQTGKNQLLVNLLQLEGKRKMSAEEFMLGHHIQKGEKLGR